MEKREAYPERSYLSQFLLFIGLSGLGFLIGAAVSIFIGAALGIDMEAINDNTLSFKDLNYLKLLQGLASILMFLFPAVAFILIQKEKIFQHLKLNRFFHFIPLLLIPIMWASFGPFLTTLMEWNSGLNLPAFLSDWETSMIEAEKNAAITTKIFLKMDHWSDLVLNLYIVALIPAFVEEILYRGVLQQLLERWTKNPHIAIWISGAIFSAIHFQFFGFLGRWALGIWLGYLFYWSRNLWYPILAHLVNNGVLVLLIYFKVVDPPTFPAESSDMPMWQVLGVSLIFLAALWAFKEAINKWNPPKEKRLT